jgi:putative hydrolase of the HAD superfamily
VSCEVGAEKPSPRIFAAALDRFDARAEHVLHVGDDPQADWAGGKAAGMLVFELRRPENSLRDLLAAATEV